MFISKNIINIFPESKLISYYYLFLKRIFLKNKQQNILNTFVFQTHFITLNLFYVPTIF
jgi:hypothetical protein